jgi:hypothetical protein
MFLEKRNLVIVFLEYFCLDENTMIYNLKVRVVYSILFLGGSHTRFVYGDLRKKWSPIFFEPRREIILVTLERITDHVKMTVEYRLKKIHQNDPQRLVVLLLFVFTAYQIVSDLLKMDLPYINIGTFQCTPP